MEIKSVYKFINPNTGQLIIIEGHEQAKAWLDNNRLRAMDCEIRTDVDKYRFEKDRFELTKNLEALSFEDFAKYALSVMWFLAKHWYGSKHCSKKLREYINNIANPNDPEIKELLLKYLGKMIGWGILLHRMMNNDFDPDIKGLHHEIAPIYQFITKQNLPYSTLQKVLRNPSDKNIRLDKRLAILGFVLRHMGNDFSPMFSGSAVGQMGIKFREDLKQEFEKRSKIKAAKLSR